MFRSLKVSFTTPGLQLIHEWHNFGEDVYRALRGECEISIEEIDTSTHEFFVRRIHRRKLRAIAARVRKIAERSPLSPLITICEAVERNGA